MNFALSLATNHNPGVKIDWPLNDSTVAPELFEKELEARLLPLGVSEKTRAAVLNQARPRVADGAAASVGQAHDQAQPKPATMKAAPASSALKTPAMDWQNAQMAGLLLGSPEFQKR